MYARDKLEETKSVGSKLKVRETKTRIVAGIRAQSKETCNWKQDVFQSIQTEFTNQLKVYFI